MGLWANAVSFLPVRYEIESVSIGATASGDGCGDLGWPRQCLFSKKASLKSTEQKQAVSLETPVIRSFDQELHKNSDRGPKII